MLIINLRSRRVLNTQLESIKNEQPRAHTEIGNSSRDLRLQMLFLGKSPLS